MTQQKGTDVTNFDGGQVANLQTILDDMQINNLRVRYEDVTPTVSTINENEIVVFDDGTDQNIFFVTREGNLMTVSASSAPTGSAGGDLQGTYPNPTLSDSAIIDNTQLNTSLSEVSSAVNANLTVTGGTYLFWPQVKTSASDTQERQVWGTESALGTTYISTIRITRTSATGFAQFRFVTASGLDFWLFILTEKSTGEILSCTAAPDHVSYGNGGNPGILQHPFLDYDSTKHEIVIVDSDTITELKSRVTGEKSILRLIDEEFEVNINKSITYTPLHLGSFTNVGNTRVPDMLTDLPSNISVRELSELTSGQKVARKQRLIDLGNSIGQEKLARKQAFMAKHNFNEEDMIVLKEII